MRPIHTSRKRVTCFDEKKRKEENTTFALNPCFEKYPTAKLSAYVKKCSRPSRWQYAFKCVMMSDPYPRTCRSVVTAQKVISTNCCAGNGRNVMPPIERPSSM